MARAIVVAAGRSRRMGEGINKQLLPLAGRPVLAHSLAVLEEASCIEDYILVVSNPEVGKFSRLAREQWGFRKLAGVVPGGERRQDSVWEGLRALPEDTQVVLVHDGARPFLRTELVSQVVMEATRWGAATLGVPVKDTVKKVDAEGFVFRTPSREGLWLAQTPQAFSFSLLREAHRRARAMQVPATDDASLVEAMGCRVKVVEGSDTNIKITTPGDLVVARAIAAQFALEKNLPMKTSGSPMRIGFGYDVHRLVGGRSLILGGVKIPFEKGLAGHSDADVLTHAIIDALLGAAGAGDIGRHFPDTQPRYRDISSLVLLEQAGKVVRERGLDIVNIDAVIVAQAPKLAGYLPAMEELIVRALGVGKEKINIKATTTEGLGFAGAGEGMAAYAVAALQGD